MNLRDGVLHHRLVHRRGRAHASRWRTTARCSTADLLRIIVRTAAHRRRWSPCCASLIAVPYACFMAGSCRRAGAGCGGPGARAAVGVATSSRPTRGARWCSPAAVLDSSLRRDAGLRPDRGRAHPDLPVAALHGAAGVRGARAAPDVAARGVGRPRRARRTTFRRVVLPLDTSRRSRRARSSRSALSLGDYIAVQIVGGERRCSARRCYQNNTQRPALRGGARALLGDDHGGVPAGGTTHRRSGQPVRTG